MGWEDEIDVDDSDLPSLLLQPAPFFSSSSSNPSLARSIPSLLPCSQSSRPSQTLAPNPPPPPPPPSPPRIQSPPLVSERQEDEFPRRSTTVLPRLIPGPAGAVQAAMHRKSATAAGAAARDPGSASCWEGLDRDGRMLDMDEEDGDFKLNPWICAMEFLGSGAGCSLVSPISSIKMRSVERVPQVVGIIKSCTPNGLGDLFLSLKDPTGTIGASVHRKVLTESNLGSDISVGCVFILEQVVAFCPARAMRYLNVTMKNVVKLISKDCGPPHKQVVPSFTARLHPSDQASAEVPSRHRIESSADEEVRRDFNCEEMMNSRKTGTAENLPCSTSATTPTTQMSTGPGFCLGRGMEIGLRAAAVKPSIRDGAENTAADEVRGNFNCRMMMDGRMTGLAGNMPCSTSAAAATAIIPAKPDPKTNGPKNLISRVSVAEWTDEQLLELFADYQDDAELLHPCI